VISPRGRRWEAYARAVVAQHGGICHLCGLSHGGARQADHLIAAADRPDLAWVAANLRPAHGAPGNPCPVCSAAAAALARKTGASPRRIYCNQLRSAMTVGRARRILAELTELEMPGERRQDPGGPAFPDPDAGRPW
jgi:hypothetical protein